MCSDAAKVEFFLSEYLGPAHADCHGSLETEQPEHIYLLNYPTADGSRRMLLNIDMFATEHTVDSAHIIFMVQLLSVQPRIIRITSYSS